MQLDTKPRGGNTVALLVVSWPRGFVPLMARARVYRIADTKRQMKQGGHNALR